MTDEFWARYNGTKRREVARRPIEAIVREKEQLALAAMTGRSAPHVKLAVNAPGDRATMPMPPPAQLYRFVESEPEPANPSQPGQALPALSVGLRVRGLDPSRERFGEEGTVVALYDSGNYDVRPDEYPRALTMPRDSWLSTVFPCDAALLPPAVGMAIQYMIDAKKSATRIEGTGTITRIENGTAYVDGATGKLVAFLQDEHWLKDVWPTSLRGTS